MTMPMTPEDAADILGMSARYVRTLITRGEIPTIRTRGPKGGLMVDGARLGAWNLQRKSGIERPAPSKNLVREAVNAHLVSTIAVVWNVMKNVHREDPDFLDDHKRAVIFSNITQNLAMYLYGGTFEKRDLPELMHMGDLDDIGSLMAMTDMPPTKWPSTMEKMKQTIIEEAERMVSGKD